MVNSQSTLSCCKMSPYPEENVDGKQAGSQRSASTHRYWALRPEPACWLHHRQEVPAKTITYTETSSIYISDSTGIMSNLMQWLDITRVFTKTLTESCGQQEYVKTFQTPQTFVSLFLVPQESPSLIHMPVKVLFTISHSFQILWGKHEGYTLNNPYLLLHLCNSHFKLLIKASTASNVM